MYSRFMTATSVRDMLKSDLLVGQRREGCLEVLSAWEAEQLQLISWSESSLILRMMHQHIMDWQDVLTNGVSAMNDSQPELCQQHSTSKFTPCSASPTLKTNIGGWKHRCC